jgi:hypothetical protein
MPEEERKGDKFGERDKKSSGFEGSQRQCPLILLVR